MQLSETESTGYIVIT